MRLNKSTVLVAAGVALCAAASAMAGPRDSVTATNLPSQGANTFGIFTIATTGSYTAKYARIQGTLTKVTTADTFASEALVEFFSPSGTGGRSLVSASTTNSYTGSLAIDTFVRLQNPLVVTPGTVGGSTFEAYVDAATGPDSRWDTITVTLNDGPPTFANGLNANFGTLDRKLQYTVGNSAGSVRWLKFELARDVNSGFGTYLDIDTEGSDVSANGAANNDTEIALYDADGNVVGYDDDDGSGGLSQLSYGSGTRPGPGGGAFNYDGRDGALPAGTYYLLVRGFGPGFPAPGWSFPNTGSLQAGFITVNIRTNSGQSPFCPADYNKSGIVSVQDVFDFLFDFFAGCF